MIPYQIRNFTMVCFRLLPPLGGFSGFETANAIDTRLLDAVYVTDAAMGGVDLIPFAVGASPTETDPVNGLSNMVGYCRACFSAEAAVKISFHYKPSNLILS